MTRALVLAGPGTNREGAAVRALQMAGATADVALTAQLLDDPVLLDRAHLLVIAGGFSYADALGAGRMFGLDLARGADGAVGERLAHFVATGRPVLGICNGFQVLVRAGLLPGAQRAGTQPHRRRLGGAVRLPVGAAARRAHIGQRVDPRRRPHRVPDRAWRGPLCAP
jgi:phosphoribosylformylglycinamidine (FGAM) synthase-like amidotransferase family enzyme